MQRIIFNLVLSLIWFVPSLVFADDGPAGIGAVATNLMGPVSFLSDIINTGAVATGTAFIFGSVIKYMQYRNNPLAVPISTPVFLLIMGIVLVLLPLAYKLAYDVPPTLS